MTAIDPLAPSGREPRTDTRTVRLTATALLLDMDGTLVDSSVVVERTWAQFARRHGLDVRDVLAVSHGRPTAQTVRMFAPPGIDRVAEHRRIERAEIDDTDGVVAVPGAAGLVARLPPGRWALVTSAGRRLAERRMAAAGLPLPAVVVTADDVAAGKPDPEGYLAAATRLGCRPEEAVVVEDAAAGVEAGLAAGCRTVLVGRAAVRDRRGLYRVPELSGLRVDPRPDGDLTIRWTDRCCSATPEHSQEAR